MRRKSASHIFLVILIVILTLPIEVNSQVIYKESTFRSPVNIEIFLAGNFAEVRSNHFHSGIDIKTLGKTGQPILAIEDAHVSRIKVEPGGYGNALYLRHPNGYTSVYGHLREFSPELTKYIREQQYKRKSFRVDLFPQAGAIKFKKGDLIALSGNSGSSQGPHLHFEIRDTQTENPLNPLLFPFDVTDTRAPVIYSVNVYSLTGRQELKAPKKYPVSGSGSKYYLSGSQPIPVDKVFGLGIESLDFLNGSSNKCGVYSIKTFLDGELYFNSITDEFSFAESRYINSFVDYKEYQKKRSSLYKTFIEPNNQLSIFQFSKNKGVIKLEDDDIHLISFEITDVAGNSSLLEFKVKRDTSGQYTAEEQLTFYNAYFHYAERNTFEEENLRVDIPSKALYANLYFTYETRPGPKGTYSRVHKIHNESVALHKSMKISIKPDSLPAHLKQYALIARINDRNQKSSVGGKWENGMLVASTRVFGAFVIAVDTVPPKIRPRNFSSGSDINKLDIIKFTISDNFSGIADYQGKIDGEWVLFEYDAKNRLLSHDLRYRPLDPNVNHKLELTVKDGRGNKQLYSVEIK